MAFDPRSDRSLPELFADLSRETIELVRKEIALARAEVSEKVSSAERGLSALAIGAAIMLAGLFILLQAVVKGVEVVLPPELAPWLAPLIVGLVIAVIGYIMVRGGRTRLQPEQLVPHRTVDSLRRDKAVAQETVR